jgi:phosphatidylserine/phosphatidylglycerophosphate/cardiolipin synthase-like enzyme
MIRPFRRLTLAIRSIPLALAILTLITPLIGNAATNSPVVYDAQVSLAFGPQCRVLLVNAIKQAHKEVYIAIYTITDKPIYMAIADAAARGVRVRVKYDKASAEFPSMKAAIGELKKRGVYCQAITMKGDAKMHNKFTVIDRQQVLTGSYNYTTMATFENDENLVLIDSGAIAERYLTEFKKIR